MVALPPIDPARLIVPPAQMLVAVPAFAVAASVTVIVTFDVILVQGPEPSGSVEVSVNATVPLVMEGV